MLHSPPDATVTCFWSIGVGPFQHVAINAMLNLDVESSTVTTVQGKILDLQTCALYCFVV